jgi:hypothetical protein
VGHNRRREIDLSWTVAGATRFWGTSCLLLAYAFSCLAVPTPLSAEDVGGETTADEYTGDSATSLNQLNMTAESIGMWIAELSHDAYPVRQTAASRLLAAGIGAREPLMAVVDGPDPEVRAAARRLILLIDQSEFQRRLGAFADDVDGRRGLTLPGWEAYRALVGGNASARALFVEMQREEGPLLSAVFGASSSAAEQRWEERLMRLVQWPAGIGERGAAPPLGSCAAMLFLATSAHTTVSDRGADWIEYLIQRPPLREAISAADANDSVRRLVSRWIVNCPNQSERILLQRLNLASTIHLKEALPLALAVAGGDPQYARVAPITRAIAVLLVGQLGDRQHANDLEPLLEDSSVCMPVQAQIPGQAAPNVQVRDAALVVMLHLTGQRPMDYGYLHARLQPQRLFQLQTLFRDNDAQRTEAVAKWRAWRVSADASDQDSDDVKSVD